MKDLDFRYDLLPLKNKLFRLALRITLDTAEAEDVTQETLLRIWSKRHELGELKSLEAYSLTICRNLALDRSERKEAQNLPLDEQALQTADTTPSPEEQLEHEEKLRRIHLSSTASRKNNAQPCSCETSKERATAKPPKY